MNDIFIKRLKQIMLDKNISQAELSNLTGIRASSISDYISGKYNPKQDKIQLLASALNIRPSWLLGYDDNTNSLSTPVGLSIPNFKHVPLLGSTAAGKPMMSDEYTEEYVDVSNKYNIDFCLRVKGESMIDAGINHGDIVFIHKQDTIENGQIAVVRINGDEVTLKRVYKTPSGVMLQSENPDRINYAPMFFDEANTTSFLILGRAILIQSEIK